MSELLEVRLIALARSFEGTLPSDVVAEIIDLSMHREWGVALENLCQQINEYNVPLKASDFEAIRLLTKEMEMPETTWSFLKPSE